MTTKYVEYNMINNVPILLPSGAQNVLYAPRYTIADADKLLHCFDKNKQVISIFNTPFRYIRVPLDKGFTTLPGVKALYYYVMVDNTIEYDGLDFRDKSTVLKWLRDKQNNHFVLVTTPVLQYKHMFYNVANDNDFKIIRHTANELMDDKRVLQRLLKNSCYTICDNYNIVISLWQNRHIDKSTFTTMIKLLNHLKNFYYTPSIWMYLINNHRILSACDNPLLYLSLTPYLIANDPDVLQVIQPGFNDNTAYMQTTYKQKILFTTFISSSYPNTNVKYLKAVSGESLCFDYTILPEHYWQFSKESTFVNDFYGFFAAIVHNNDMWRYWCNNKAQLLSKLSTKHYDVLCALFRLYTVGYEGINVKKKRVHSIWMDILSNSGATDIFQYLAYMPVNVPYIFLLDVYRNYNIDFGREIFIYYLDPYTDKLVYRLSTIYCMLKDNFHHFHKNVLKKRSICILMCIYKRFGLFSTSDVNPMSEVGNILMHYYQDHINYLC